MCISKEKHVRLSFAVIISHDRPITNRHRRCYNSPDRHTEVWSDKKEVNMLTLW